MHQSGVSTDPGEIARVFIDIFLPAGTRNLARIGSEVSAWPELEAF